MEVRIGIGVVKSRPVVLIGTVRVPWPLQKILRSLVVDDEFNKSATEDAVRTAADNVDVVGRWRVRHVHVLNFPQIYPLSPYL